MVNVGGFFASLALMTDENSFKKGIGVLTAFADIQKKGIAGAVGLGVAMVGLGASTANAMTKLAATAKQLGMNALTLDNWQNAVRLAGGDADSFTSSIQTMNEAFRNLKIGEVKEDFIKATGMSGADFSKLQGMNNDKRLRTIWGALEKVQDPGKQQALIQKIFGQGGVDLFARMQNQGTTLGGLYSQAAAMNPNTQADYNAAIKGNQANESIAVSFQNTINKLGIEIEKSLLPSLEGLAQWLRDNKDSLTQFAKAVGDATAAVVSFFGFLFTKQEDRQQVALGGALNNTIFKAFEKKLGIEEGSLQEGFLTLSLPFNKDYQALMKESGSGAYKGMDPSAAASAIFQKTEADKVRGLFPKNLSDSLLASLYEKRESLGNIEQKDRFQEGAKNAIQKAELTLKIDGNKPLSAAQSKQITDALYSAGILSVRQ